ncbi:hypothetical protein Leryth_021722 [Lithospermum erythrorhizon]|nr:hypothetical protein Leryth_021722 [Lithospermum erythrorhizon]
MVVRILTNTHSSNCPIQQNFIKHTSPPPPNNVSFILTPFQPLLLRNRLITCITPNQENNNITLTTNEAEIISENEVVGFAKEESIWKQMVEIAKFSGPACGLWLCWPLMSLIDTAVVGQTSSLQLAALGPGTVLCDHTAYVFMFLSIATSNLVAIALAKQDKDAVQHQISILVFIGFVSGVLMLVLTIFFGPWALSAFTGANNKEIIAAANTYVQIRAFSWPVSLVGWVAESASLGMKDSWGPLQAVLAASAINIVGDVVLCKYFGFGIAGAAWATLLSQVIASFMMIDTLNKKGYNSYSMAIPSRLELMNIFMLAAPIFITMISKVLFLSLLVYSATSMGTHTVAAHQVMIQLHGLCSVLGEPLAQTAQSFMPELLYGQKRNLSKARHLLKSLVIIGALSGLILGSIGISVPWFFPGIFSNDPKVIVQMHQVLILFFAALCVTPSTLSLEGTLLAGQDLKFISLSMSGIFCLGSLLVLLLTSKGIGLTGCWLALVAFQWSRFLIALLRLASPTSFLNSEDVNQLNKLKTA